MDQSHNGRWCILRTAGPATLTVVEALQEVGYEAWTPVEVQKRRIGRQREVRETNVPLTPGILFARDERLSDLIAMSHSPALSYRKFNSETQRMETRGCPYFKVFRYQGQYPRIADRDLDPLRVAEKRFQPRPAQVQFQPGDDVRCPDGGFDGLVGKVEKTVRRLVFVLFPGFSIPIQIDAQRLLSDREAA